MSGPKCPVDVATTHTVSFVSANVSNGASILEIGCGRGEVAIGLEKRGWRVTGIDADEEAAAIARRAGLNVVHAAWPYQPAGKFDAVLFSRSLHHIHDLHPAVSCAAACLKPGGALLVEDFAFDAVDKQTAEWFRDILVNGSPDGAGDYESGSFAATLVRADDAQAAWKEEHGHHHLHTFDAMARAIQSSFKTFSQDTTHYLYRYLIPTLPQSVEAAEFLANVFEKEADAISTATIAAVGRRAVARL